MEIVRYHPHLLSDVAALYNRATEGIPHCYPVGSEDLGAALERADRPGATQDVWVARADRAVIGLVHALVEPDSDDPRRAPRNALRFLWYERAERTAGQALLETAEGWLRQQRPRDVWAFHAHDRYWFYHFKNAYLTDHFDHVGALLQLNGYRKAAGEVFMDWPEYPEREPVEVRLDLEVQVGQLEQSRGDRAATALKAFVGGECVGECWCRSGGEYSRNPAAMKWTFVDWLGVQEPYRGLGLGKHLLQRGLNEMRATGHRHACISTAWNNFRAFVLYTHFGFRVVDWTYGLRKEVSGNGGIAGA